MSTPSVDIHQLVKYRSVGHGERDLAYVYNPFITVTEGCDGLDTLNVFRSI